MVLKAGARRLTPTTFATESAFVEHLRALRKLLAPRFDSIVVGMPEMSAAEYDTIHASLTTVDEEAEQIFFEAIFQWPSTRARFLRELPRVVRKLSRLVGQADLVHSHPSYDLYRPIETLTSILAIARKKKLITVTDLDYRGDAEMNYRTGYWSRRSYLVCKYIYDPIRNVQQQAYVKFADLVLFKEAKQVEDYGHGASHVRFFLDPNFNLENVVDDATVRAKIATLEDDAAPLRAFYFGRFVAYKGIDKMIEAVALARAGGANLTLDIMGVGPEEQALKALAERRGISDIVRWLEPRAYGESFFSELRSRHLLLACPLSADTPRSTWDALASAVPVLAYDTTFYRKIANQTGAVELVPWLSVAPFAEKLGTFARDKRPLGPMMKNAVAAARDNTAEEWLKRRVAWTEELFTTA
jgi:glycosyltransferase involved in cell wall biosynthesis